MQMIGEACHDLFQTGIWSFPETLDDRPRYVAFIEVTHRKTPGILSIGRQPLPGAFQEMVNTILA